MPRGLKCFAIHAKILICHYEFDTTFYKTRFRIV